MTESPGNRTFAPPPRTITTPLAARVTLGSLRSQVGWLVLGFGSIFFWGFIWNIDLSGWRFAFEPVEHTSGKFLNCNDTNFVRGQRRRTRGIYENHYQFELVGRIFQGSSFSIGGCAAGPLRIEYLRAHPEVSRIAGMRRRPFGPSTLLVDVVPAVGLFMVFTGFVQGCARLRLLRDGLPATGRLIDKTRMNASTNRGNMYRLTFAYTSQKGATGRVTASTARPELFEDKEGALVFYHPADLKRAVLLASLPGRVDAGERGQPVASPSRAFLVLPALTLLGNLWYVYRHWLAGP
ncbi:MAG: hypothetical protein ABSF54_21385 [Bryobacteraceae bacterium]|jgi:hypothetical protein